mgnify:CR=1 FL=1
MNITAPTTIENIITLHDQRYPGWTAQDLYKLLFQSAMGNEHAVTDEAGVSQWLERELREMGEGPQEPLIDPISPGGEVLRVHLRPMVKEDLEATLVLRAFLVSPAYFQGSRDALEGYLQIALRMAEKGNLSIRFEDLKVYVGQMRAAGWPAVHHSPEFERRYKPAYRVVVRAALEAEFLAGA